MERFKFGAGDRVVCKTAFTVPVVVHGACAIMRVSVVPRKLLLLIGKDTLKVFEARLGLENNIGCFPGAGDFQGKNVVRQSSWALDGTLVARFVLGGFMIRSRHERQRHHRFSAHVTNEVFSVR